jgi:hypothetical protein
MRTDARVEDKARGKRLFGNLLGTLQKFKNEEKTTRGSEAVSPGRKHLLSMCLLIPLIGETKGTGLGAYSLQDPKGVYAPS